MFHITNGRGMASRLLASEKRQYPQHAVLFSKKPALTIMSSLLPSLRGNILAPLENVQIALQMSANSRHVFKCPRIQDMSLPTLMTSIRHVLVLEGSVRGVYTSLQALRVLHPHRLALCFSSKITYANLMLWTSSLQSTTPSTPFSPSLKVGTIWMKMEYSLRYKTYGSLMLLFQNIPKCFNMFPAFCLLCNQISEKNDEPPPCWSFEQMVLKNTMALGLCINCVGHSTCLRRTLFSKIIK